MGAFKLILGTPVNAVPQPWRLIKFDGVMVNAYELLSTRRRSELRGRGLRRLLGIDDDTELWIDSGGYQFLKNRLKPNPEKLIRLYREIDADYYVSLDYPPGPRDPPGERATKIAKTVATFMEMRSSLRGIAREGRLVPVFHITTGEGLELQLREYEPHAVAAAIGGLIPYVMQRAGKGSRLKAVLFMLLARRLWHGRLHALGLASAAMLPLLRAIGVDSGDTQTWRHKAAFGKVVIPGLGERHVSGRKVRFGPAVLREEDEVKLFNEYLEKAEKLLGINTAMIAESFEARALFNAWMIKHVAENGYGYRGSSKAFQNLYATIEALGRQPAEVIEAMLSRLMNGEAAEPAEEGRVTRTTVSATPGAVGHVAVGVSET